jgi:K+-transporting ATPase KdpF subunit
MNTLYLIGGIVVTLLLVYLFVAMFSPETFE